LFICWRTEPLINPQSRELYLLGKYKPETSSLLDMSRLPRPCLSQTQTAVDRQEPRLKQSSAPPRLLPSPSHRVNYPNVQYIRVKIGGVGGLVTHSPHVKWRTVFMCSGAQYLWCSGAQYLCAVAHSIYVKWRSVFM